MFVITTIYLTELDAIEHPQAEIPEEQSVIDLDDASRELLGIYRGKNRALPLDWERYN